jgi:hypothetical protein
VLNPKSVFFTPVVVLALATPVFAGVATNVSVQDALSGRVRVTVAVEGGGTILDFSQTGEKIEKITLDDPSKVMTDHCLITKSCNGHPEPMVRLFRVSIPDKNIPSAKITQLTVMTSDPSGQWNSYIFAVIPTAKPSVYTKFLIGGRVSQSRSTDFAATTLGARQAQSQNLLVDPALKGRVNTYLRLVQAGMSDRLAAQKAGISMALVSRLNTLGQTAVAQASTQQPTLSAAPTLSPLPSGGAGLPDPQTQPSRAKAKNSKSTPPSATKGVTVPVTSTSRNANTVPTSGIFWATPLMESHAVNSGAQPSNRPAQAFNGQVYAGALLKGLNAARLSGTIPFQSKAWRRVNSAYRVLKRGGSLQAAIQASGMKKDRFLRLLRRGGVAL